MKMSLLLVKLEIAGQFFAIKATLVALHAHY